GERLPVPGGVPQVLVPGQRPVAAVVVTVRHRAGLPHGGEELVELGGRVRRQRVEGLQVEFHALPPVVGLESSGGCPAGGCPAARWPAATKPKIAAEPTPQPLAGYTRPVTDAALDP